MVLTGAWSFDIFSPKAFGGIERRKRGGERRRGETLSSCALTFVLLLFLIVLFIVTTWLPAPSLISLVVTTCSGEKSPKSLTLLHVWYFFPCLMSESKLIGLARIIDKLLLSSSASRASETQRVHRRKPLHDPSMCVFARGRKNSDGLLMSLFLCFWFCFVFFNWWARSCYNSEKLCLFTHLLPFRQQLSANISIYAFRNQT